MLRQKRRLVWTAPMVLQAALMSAGTAIASDDAVKLRVSSVEVVKDKIADAKPANDEEDEDVRSAPVPKTRSVKARPTRGEQAEVHEEEVIRKKQGAAAAGSRITVKSADGRTFEIVTPDGAKHVVEGKVPPGKPTGANRALTILRTPDGEHILQMDEVDTLIDDLTLSFKDKLAAEAPKFIIGVSVSEAPRVLMVQLGRDEETAVVVDSVMDDSPAAKAGVKQFDVILKAAGEPIESAPDLTKAVKSSEGKELEFVLLRTGKELKIDITPRPNEPLHLRTKVSDGVIHVGPAVMERRPIGHPELMFGPGPLHEEIKALRKDMAELKEMVEKLKAEK